MSQWISSEYTGTYESYIVRNLPRAQHRRPEPRPIPLWAIEQACNADARRNPFGGANMKAEQYTLGMIAEKGVA